MDLSAHDVTALLDQASALLTADDGIDDDDPDSRVVEAPWTVTGCCGVPVILMTDHGFWVCRSCGTQIKTDWLNYGAGDAEVLLNIVAEHAGRGASGPARRFIRKSIHTRLGHFRVRLAQLRGNQSTQIPEHIRVLVKSVLAAWGYTGRAELAGVPNGLVRHILKQAGFPTLQKHERGLLAQLGAELPFAPLSHEQEATLIADCRRVELAWRVLAPPSRKNFPCGYVLVQLLALHGWLPAYETYLRMPVTPRVLAANGRIWSAVCVRLGFF